MAVIFHVDVNSAFLSWTALRLLSEGHPEDIRNIPSAIAAGDEKSRHGIVLAKSVPAKAYGIKTAETIYSAKKKCPQIRFFPPDFKTFHYYSDKMYELLLEYSPIVQRFSIDECFVDYTASEKLFGPPEQAAMEIKERIKNELGFTVNVGVSHKKVLAKMASDFEKPDKLHTLYETELADKLWQLPIEELFMAGKSASAKLHSVNINTIGDLARADKGMVYSLLKSHGTLLWEYANGIDDTPVLTEDMSRDKSIGNSTTLSHDVTDREEAYKILLWLSEKSVGRLRKQGYLATQMTVSFKTDEFRTYSHQMQVPGGVSTLDEVYFYAKRLFDDGWRGEPLRLLGVSLGGLSREAGEQLSIFTMPEVSEDGGDETAGYTQEEKEKSEALEAAMGLIREKFGDKAVTVAGLTERKERIKNQLVKK